MKKRFLLFGLVFVSFFLLSGCGTVKTESKEQVLRCLANSSGVDVGLNVTFKGIKITNMNLYYEMDLSEFDDERIEAAKSEDYCSVVKQSLSQYENAFKNCTQDISNKKLKVVSDLDIDKMSDSESNMFGTIETAKKGLEEVGYTCTIE